MANVVSIGGCNPLPDMTVIELAIITALLRKGPGTVAMVAPLLAEWFRCPIDAGQLAGPIQRMVAREWLVAAQEGFLIPAPAAIDPVKLLYPGFIRMFGDSLEEVAPGEEPQLRDFEKWRD